MLMGRRAELLHHTGEQDRYGQSVDHAVQAAQGVADGVYASRPWNR